MVGVEIGQGGHRQNFAGAGPEHEAGGADGGMFFDAEGQFAFDDVLQAGVEGEDDVEAVARGDVLIAVGDQLALALVQSGLAPAADAAEFGVKGQLDAVEAGLLVVVGDVTQNVGGEALTGIEADLVVIGENGLGAEVVVEGPLAEGQPGFVDGRAEMGHGELDFVPGVEGDFAFEDDVFGEVGFAVAGAKAREEAGGEERFIGAEQRGEGAGDLEAMVAEQGGVGADDLGGLAGGQGDAAAVEDLAASGFALDGADGVAEGQGLEFVMAQDLQVHQAVTESGQRPAEEEGQQR